MKSQRIIANRECFLTRKQVKHIQRIEKSRHTRLTTPKFTRFVSTNFARHLNKFFPFHDYSSLRVRDKISCCFPSMMETVERTLGFDSASPIDLRVIDYKDIFPLLREKLKVEKQSDIRKYISSKYRFFYVTAFGDKPIIILKSFARNNCFMCSQKIYIFPIFKEKKRYFQSHLGDSTSRKVLLILDKYIIPKVKLLDHSHKIYKAFQLAGFPLDV